MWKSSVNRFNLFAEKFLLMISNSLQNMRKTYTKNISQNVAGKFSKIVLGAIYLNWIETFIVGRQGERTLCKNKPTRKWTFKRFKL